MAVRVPVRAFAALGRSVTGTHASPPTCLCARALSEGQLENVPPVVAGDSHAKEPRPTPEHLDPESTASGTGQLVAQDVAIAKRPLSGTAP